jgi:2-phosphoglycerate kinase
MMICYASQGQTPLNNITIDSVFLVHQGNVNQIPLPFVGMRVEFYQGIFNLQNKSKTMRELQDSLIFKLKAQNDVLHKEKAVLLEFYKIKNEQLISLERSEKIAKKEAKKLKFWNRILKILVPLGVIIGVLL